MPVPRPRPLRRCPARPRHRRPCPPTTPRALAVPLPRPYPPRRRRRRPLPRRSPSPLPRPRRRRPFPDHAVVIALYTDAGAVPLLRQARAAHPVLSFVFLDYMMFFPDYVYMCEYMYVYVIFIIRFFVHIYDDLFFAFL